jgi:hypothetical protein
LMVVVVVLMVVVVRDASCWLTFLSKTFFFWGL